MAATIISGISGAVSIAGNTTGASTIAEWSITPGKQTPEGSASNTAGAPVVVVGNEDWSGKMRSYGKEPVAYPGASISFVGYNGQGSFAGTALVTSVSLTVDIATGAPLTWDYQFVGNSTVTLGSTVVVDATAPAMFTSAVCKVQWSATLGGSFADIAGVQRFTLTLTRDPKTYAQSQIIKRVAGKYGLSATVDLDEADPSVQLLAGDISVYKFFVDATTFFKVGYLAVDNPEQNVPIESGEIVAYRMPLKWTFFKSITGTMTRGVVTKPDTTNWLA